MLIALEVRPEVPPLAGFTHVRMILRFTFIGDLVYLALKLLCGGV